MLWPQEVLAGSPVVPASPRLCAGDTMSRQGQSSCPPTTPLIVSRLEACRGEDEGPSTRPGTRPTPYSSPTDLGGRGPALEKSKQEPKPVRCDWGGPEGERPGLVSADPSTELLLMDGVWAGQAPRGESGPIHYGSISASQSPLCSGCREPRAGNKSLSGSQERREGKKGKA